MSLTTLKSTAQRAHGDPGERSARPARSLSASFSWTLAGNLVYAACQAMILSTMAKLGGAEAVGMFALGLAICGPVFACSMLQLRTVVATDVRQEFAFADYLGLRLLTSAAAVGIVLMLAGLGGYQTEALLAIGLVAAAKFSESISDIYSGQLQRQERMDRIAASMMLKGVLSLGAIAASLAATGSIAVALAAMLAVWLTVLLGYDIPAVLRLNRLGVYADLLPRLHPSALSRLAAGCWPLGVSMTLISLSANVPRLFVAHCLGDRALGYFAAIAYWTVVGMTIVSALGQSAAPRLARHFASGDLREFQQILVRLAAIVLLLGATGVLLAVVAGETILTLLYTAEYASHQGLLLILAAAGAVSWMASILGYGLTAARCFRMPVVVIAAATLVLAALCFVLIPRYGLVGAALAALAAAVVQLLGFLWGLAYAVRGAAISPKATEWACS